jgi:hypothetical protein
MKNKIEAFFKYLSALKTKSATIYLQCDWKNIDYWDGNIETDNRGDINLPQNFESYIIDLYDEYSETIYSDSFYGIDGDYSESYDTVVEIDVPKKRITFRTDIRVYDTESAGTSYEFEEGDYKAWKDIINEYLDSYNTDTIKIEYNGSGDSGDLGDVYNDETNQMIDYSASIEDICYDLLSGDFSGWEINEGSSGEILIKRDGIYVEHLWNTEENITSDLDLILDISDLPE